jgi:hypothetical protein
MVTMPAALSELQRGLLLERQRVWIGVS